MPTISAGGVPVFQALAKVPAFNAASSLCRGRIGNMSSSPIPGA